MISESKSNAVAPIAARRAPKRHWPTALMLLLPAAYFISLAWYGLNVDDEGTLLYQIYRTYLGQILYDDFHAGYTPGIFYWNAAVFWLFGVNVVAIRLCLAVINGLSVFCMYWLGRRLGASRLAAAIAGLAYIALIPYYDGQFAAFNIPYPIWYVTLFWLLSVIAAVRWWERNHAWHWLVAGVCAGVVFTFKPNSGLLNLSFLLLVLTRLQAPSAPATPARGLRWLLIGSERLLRWLIPLVLLIGLTQLFLKGAGGGWREVRIFALPLLIVAAYKMLVPAARAVARPVKPLALWRDLIVLGLGFGAVITPWVAYFWNHLSTWPFLRAVLFIGTNFDRFYFMPYPWYSTWDWAAALGLAALYLIGRCVRRGWLPLRLVVIVGVLAGAVVSASLLRHPPPMIEGFQPSLVMRVRNLAFSWVLLTGWVAIVAFIVRTRRSGANGSLAGAAPARVSRFSGTLFILVVSGVLMHMQLYPRTDFMHLVPASPGILILGAWLLHALVRLWQTGARTPRGRAITAAAVFAPVYIAAGILLAPALMRIEYLARAWWTHDATALVRLDSPRAPLVIEPAAGEQMQELGATAQYLRENARPQDHVFTFPAIDLVSFLADRQNPTRHGYFYPGWPGRDVEAEVIDALRERPPRFIVTLHAHELFFMSAPVYYFNLRRYVTDRYRLARRIGMFDILGPNDITPRIANADISHERQLTETVPLWRAELAYDGSAAAARLDAALAGLPSSDIGPLADAVAALDPATQALVVKLIRKSRSAAGAAALATTLEGAALDPDVRELFTRAISETGDVRAIAPLLRAYKSAPDFGTLGQLVGNLFTIVSRAWVEDYWYAPSDREEFAEIGRMLDVAQLINWMDNPWELPALRAFGIRMAGRLGNRTVVPFLLRVLGDDNESPFLRSDAAHSLFELGVGAQALPAITALLSRDSLVPAVLTMNLYAQAPQRGRTAVLDLMRVTDDDTRAVAYWMAAGITDPKLLEALQAGLTDRTSEVRIAAAWGLGRLRAEQSVPALTSLAHDGNDRVAGYAVRAIAAIKKGGE
ncbi:MAG: HEAT repeat domain-containing protein [Deltaproteobacteria bacterium]|nr:HEAT repeat domain-containing protein [Deltaproteobacteria bacterium]MBI3391496.1 HEAT repeat domain-containing protein [Deltaproteobacteria bacterium]